MGDIYIYTQYDKIQRDLRDESHKDLLDLDSPPFAVSIYCREM